MRKETVYTDAPKVFARELDEAEIVEDFLPPPERMVFKTPTMKVAKKDFSFLS